MGFFLGGDEEGPAWALCTSEGLIYAGATAIGIVSDDEEGGAGAACGRGSCGGGMGGGKDMGIR